MHDSPGEPVTGPPADPGHAVLRIASVNLESGGLSEAGDGVRWRKSVAALLAQDPHVVLCQEMTALSAFRRRTANELGMTPVLGPPAPPRSAVTTGHNCWAPRIARDGALAVAGGDWNCYAPAVMLTPETLAAMPPHLRPPRMRVTAGVLEANYDGRTPWPSPGSLTLRRSCREGPAARGELTPTGINGGGGSTAFTSPSRSPGRRAGTSSAIPAAVTTRRCC